MGKARILLVGSSSLVGSHFVETFGNEYEISGLGRKNIFERTDLLSSFDYVNIQNEVRVKEAVGASSAEFVINCAAETNVDGCEPEKGDISGHTYIVNTASVRWMAEACKATGKTFYQISTDFVFDGAQGPYSEEDSTGPLRSEIGWYGYTKYLAEKELIDAVPSNYCIIRISYPYRASFVLKTDFARRILNLYQKGHLFPLFTDQIFSPTLIDDVSNAIDFLVSRDARGIYHVACRSPTTPFEFANRLIAAFFSVENAEKAMKRASVIEFNRSAGRAPRPVRGGLRTDKIQSEGFLVKTFEQGINAMFWQSQPSCNKREKEHNQM